MVVVAVVVLHWVPKAALFLCLKCQIKSSLRFVVVVVVVHFYPGCYTVLISNESSIALFNE